ncbi:MAG: phenylalanine--tRNA ligase beta subunit-related protein [Salinivirgaceae bacterium]|jgi:DNA/RNA-binding domain of Phe-tRNA-synthetase-like protein
MNPILIKLSNDLKQKVPQMALGIIQCKVSNTAFNPELWEEIQKVTLEVRENLTFEAIKDQPQIAATRTIYAACGKEPSRYRPSAEALMRRIVKGQDLYQINTLVDLINLVSLKTGYSIGGFDAEYINGNVEASIGSEGEPYQGIGKGELNIHNLPVLRDSIGAFGTPTSDEIRTAIRLETTHFLMTINGYTGAADMQVAMEYSLLLLNKFLSAKEIATYTIK